MNLLLWFVLISWPLPLCLFTATGRELFRRWFLPFLFPGLLLLHSTASALFLFPISSLSFHASSRRTGSLQADLHPVGGSLERGSHHLLAMLQSIGYIK